MAASRAWVSSTAEKRFALRPARASASVSLVRSLIGKMSPALLDDLRHQEEVLLAHRRVLDDRGRHLAVVHDVGAAPQRHGCHARHRLGVGCIDFVELLHPVQNTGQLLLECLGLRIGHPDARKPRYAPHGLLVDLHAQPLRWCQPRPWYRPQKSPWISE